MATKEGSSKPKVTLSFELTRSHILKITKAEVKIDELVRTEVKPNITKTDDDETEEVVADAEEDAEKPEDDAEEKAEEPVAEEAVDEEP